MHPAHMGGTHALLTAVDHAHAQELVLLRTMGRHSADRPVLRAPAGVNSALNTPSFRAAPGTAKEGARSHPFWVRQEAPRPKPLLNRQVNRGDSKASIALFDCELSKSETDAGQAVNWERGAQLSACGGGWAVAGGDKPPRSLLFSLTQS